MRELGLFTYTILAFPLLLLRMLSGLVWFALKLGFVAGERAANWITSTFEGNR